MYKTKDVSKIAGVSKRTLQYYDDLGLINLERDKDKYRIYDKSSLERIWNILVLKEAGFSLKEIKELFKLSNDELIKSLDRKTDVINKEIAELKLRKELLNLIKNNGLSFENSNSNNSYSKEIKKIKNNLKHSIKEE